MVTKNKFQPVVLLTVTGIYLKKIRN